MKNLFYFSLTGLVIILLSSCDASKNSTTTLSYKKLANYPCKTRLRNVFLFYDNDSTLFKYKPLGTIELTCKADCNEQEIKDRLKFLAYQNCSNAIVAIKTETVTKNYGGDYRAGAATYVAKNFKGIAVKIESDSLYKSSAFGNTQDVSFAKNVMRYNREHRNRSYLVGTGAVLVSLLLVGIFMVTTYR